MRVFVNVMLSVTVFGAGIPNILVGMQILHKPQKKNAVLHFFFCIDLKWVNDVSVLLASQNLQLIGQRVSDGEFEFSFCYWLVLLGILMCPVMWLGSPKNMKYLELNTIINN